MKVGYGTKEWVTYTLITLSKLAKMKQLEKFPRLRNQPTLLQALSTRKINKDQVQIKGIFNKNTIGNCAY
jgi:hypothetical protein